MIFVTSWVRLEQLKVLKTSISPVQGASSRIGVLLHAMAYKINPFEHKGRFFNNPRERHRPFMIPSLSMLVECYWNSFKKKEEMGHWHAPQVPLVHSEELAITWIGHSTFLIQVAGLAILTDPIFGHLPLFKRLLPPGLEMAQLPPIDYVVISHNHHDHMHASSLQFLKSNPHTQFLVPQGNKKWFDKRGFAQVSEYRWWDRDVFTRHGTAINFSFLPALHWSQRGIFDYNKTLWGSWMIGINGKQIYFAGDTAYSSHFSAIAQEFSDITCALMPIGPCEPKKWMSQSHMNAEEAGQAFLELRAQHFIPMHWGTYSFGTDYHQAPYDRLLAWWKAQNLTSNLITLKMGQRCTIEDIPLIITPKSLEQLY